jgi:hypothetical protein
MVNYECYRCGYSTNDKTKIKKHLARKRICKPIINIILLDCKDYILNGLSYNEYLETTQKIPKKYPSPKEYPQKIPISKNKEFWKCEFCRRKLSSYKNLWRHQKNCKEKKKDDELKLSMERLVGLLNDQRDEMREKITMFEKELSRRDKEIDSKNKQIDELIKKVGIVNSNITTNIQNNIELLSYKNTDVSSLSDKDILRCINHSNMCIPHLIKEIHFNPNRPENHNIYISNLKNNYILIYDGNKWNLHNRNEVIDDLINDKESIIEEKIEDWIDRCEQYPEIMKKFNRYLEKKENDIVLNKIKDEIKLILFNNRKMIETNNLLI